jgi:formylglycine-generating enzyme required for sulfatase activity
MGSELVPDAGPIREVCMPTYYLDKNEITAREYAHCVAEGPCTVPQEVNETCTWQVPGDEDHPINCVDWEQAHAYCEWVGKRLPSEAEWEKAARGADSRTYPWGEEVPSCAHANMQGCVDGWEGTVAVGSFSPTGDSPYGIHNMGGNVSEFCQDYYESYDAEDTDDPQGPNFGEVRIRRGSSLSNGTELARTYWRDMSDWAADDIGMRCALSPE